MMIKNDPRPLLYTKLFRKIISHPSRAVYRKKHGTWVILRTFYDEFFEVDTWSCAVCYKRGPGLFDRWLGFSGEVVISAGSSVETTATIEQLTYLHNIVDHTPRHGKQDTDISS